MLQIRVEGDPAEAQALLALLAGSGVEVQVGTCKRRAEGFSHTYAVVRLPDGTPPPGSPPPPPAAADAEPRAPYRTRAYVERPALPSAERRPARRRPL